MSKEEVEKLTYEQKIDLIRNGNLWCGKTFLIGLIKKVFNIIFSREFLVFSIVTFGMWFFDLFKDKTYFIGYLVLSVVFIIAESLKILIEQKTTMSINANVGASINKNINE